MLYLRRYNGGLYILLIFRFAYNSFDIERLNVVFDWVLRSLLAFTILTTINCGKCWKLKMFIYCSLNCSLFTGWIPRHSVQFLRSSISCLSNSRSCHSEKCDKTAFYDKSTISTTLRQWNVTQEEREKIILFHVNWSVIHFSFVDSISQ